ncbi:MAG: HNH endonuclease [Vibrio sp.]
MDLNQIQAEKQLDFIGYIQRLLIEGDFTATYKYALLHALADVCVELPLANESDELSIPLELLAEKLLVLYWHHAVPFTSEAVGQDALLKQNSGGQSTIISLLYKCQKNNIHTFRALKASSNWNAVLKVALKALKDGPLWRLQIIARQPECFLYPHTKSSKYIILNHGVAASFRRFYDLVVHLAKTAWIEKVQSFPYNQTLIGPQSNLNEFLFGSDRKALIKAKPLLEDIQSGLCFYCQKPLNRTAEVDHFIPFARYSNDLGHNFVAAHRACNNNKRDFLAAHHHRERWENQNLVQNKTLIDSELSAYFQCDSDKSLAVSNWAYQVASTNGAKLWLAINIFELAKN